MAQNNESEVFEEIARANPDLTGIGPETITVRYGDEIVSMPHNEFERVGTEVGEAILAGTDFMVPWAAVESQPRLMQSALAEGAYQYAVLRAFRMAPYEAQQVLLRASHFLYFAATVRPVVAGGSDV